MKISIVVDIEPDADGVRCGECKCLVVRKDPEDGYPTCRCRQYQYELTQDDRCPPCLAASQRHKRMVEALRRAERQMTCSTYNFSVVLAEIRAILREEEGK